MSDILDNQTLKMALLLGGAMAALLLVVGVFISRFYRKVDQGRALIVNTLRTEPTVTFTGAVVIPVIHRAEVMDISVRTIEIDRRGKEGLICKDNIRADIRVNFFVRVNKTAEDVLKVAQAIGCARASDSETLEQLFVAKFSEALKTVGKRLEFEELYTKRDDFRDQIIDVIGKDLNGYVLDDAAIDFLEQTPLEILDPSNILDAQGIRKITEITAGQNVSTNDLKQEELKAITKKNVEAAEAIMELEKQRADAEARQRREIASIQAREGAETLRVQAEEKQKAEVARIRQEEEVAIADENRRRQVEVAQKNRERVVAVENERVSKDRDLEAISREREVELQRIEKEKALELERKLIADAVAGRIAVEKQVAEEEERIRDLRVLAEAKRQKDAHLITAEGKAQEQVIAKLKNAEAEAEVAKFVAKQAVVKADADLEAADRVARSKLRIAEGVQAEAAADGLARVRVKEADALATEKVGLAQARITFEQLQAEAKGKEVQASAIAKVGQAEAHAKQQMLQAEAAGVEAQGLAEIKVKEADAAAIEKVGVAQATAIRERMAAEAQGLSQKAEAMQQLKGDAREHEEFRMRLEKQTEVALESLKARVSIAEEQATVMGKAVSEAKINIVGGDGAFLDKFFKAVSLGHALDGAVGNSQLLGQMADEYTSGEASLREDLKEVLSRPALTTEALKNLSVVAALNHVMKAADGTKRMALERLLAQAQDLGLE